MDAKCEKCYFYCANVDSWASENTKLCVPPLLRLSPEKCWITMLPEFSGKSIKKNVEPKSQKLILWSVPYLTPHRHSLSRPKYLLLQCGVTTSALHLEGSYLLKFVRDSNVIRIGNVRIVDYSEEPKHLQGKLQSNKNRTIIQNFGIPNQSE